MHYFHCTELLSILNTLCSQSGRYILRFDCYIHNTPLLAIYHVDIAMDWFSLASYIHL